MLIERIKCVKYVTSRTGESCRNDARSCIKGVERMKVLGKTHVQKGDAFVKAKEAKNDTNAQTYSLQMLIMPYRCILY